ncbi:hypothetical protein Pan44_38540 [Caulifigura coniformis]|uniref:Uncharacterized protein n=1 Tax=Caulifigura coniformis TaxID=2527983 RepID=A0A517SI54_9PLAN|nr:hypothetical protein Pan44_38540 [Caulifigura coniformis]
MSLLSQVENPKGSDHCLPSQVVTGRHRSSHMADQPAAKGLHQGSPKVLSGFKPRAPQGDPVARATQTPRLARSSAACAQPRTERWRTNENHHQQPDNQTHPAATAPSPRSSSAGPKGREPQKCPPRARILRRPATCPRFTPVTARSICSGRAAAAASLDRPCSTRSSLASCRGSWAATSSSPRRSV